jgi:hypothetical protein
MGGSHGSCALTSRANCGVIRNLPRLAPALLLSCFIRWPSPGRECLDLLKLFRVEEEYGSTNYEHGALVQMNLESHGGCCE